MRTTVDPDDDELALEDEARLLYLAVTRVTQEQVRTHHEALRFTNKCERTRA